MNGLTGHHEDHEGTKTTKDFSKMVLCDLCDLRDLRDEPSARAAITHGGLDWIAKLSTLTS